MNIVGLLNSENVIPNLEAKDKEEALDKLINLFESKVDEEELEKIREAVLEREKIMSTGVGKGLAIPHGKAAGISRNYAAFAILENPIDYNAVDEQPVNLIFLLVGPQSSNSFHIKMLSRISRLMNNNEFREKLIRCTDTEQILDVFKQEEQVHFGS
ncbi:MAG: PTS sugar transporter subunit IIA [Balneolaceae bacterium]|nr:PTS sugar transporter subunit IIA [Balneolaceae bacterium]